MKVTIKPIYFLTAILFIASMGIGISSKLRQSIYAMFFKAETEVLSVIKGVAITDELSMDIYKLKVGEEIVVKFFDSSSGEHFQTFSLNDKWDGYYLADGRNTNLFINDVDNDQMLEVLAPTFDRNLTARLHILKYDRESKRFKLLY